jgi:hypothetical protein
MPSQTVNQVLQQHFPRAGQRLLDLRSLTCWVLIGRYASADVAAEHVDNIVSSSSCISWIAIPSEDADQDGG